MIMPNGLTSMQQGLASQVAPNLFSSKTEKDPASRLAAAQLRDYTIAPKQKPTASDLVKLSGVSSMGFLLLNETLLKMQGPSTAKPPAAGGDFLSKMLGDSLGGYLGGVFKGLGGGTKGLASKLGPKILAKLAPVMASGVLATVAGVGLIAGGAVLAVMDGVKGAKKSKEWGVSGFNAGFSSAVTSSSKGVKGGLQGIKKYGLIGGGIGMLVGGPIGAAIGGGVGVLLGGVLGSVGGEKTSKFFQGVGKSVSGVWEKGLVPLGKGIANFVTLPYKLLGKGIDAIKTDKKLQSTLLKVGTTGLATLAAGPIGGLARWFGPQIMKSVTSLGKNIGGKLSGAFENLKKDKDMQKKLLGTATMLVNPLLGLGVIFAPQLKKTFEGLKSTVGKAFENNNMLSGIGTFLTDFVTGLWDGIKNWFGNIGENIRKFFSEKGPSNAPATPAPAPSSMRVHDAQFSLNKAAPAGSFFGKAPGVEFDKKDELYLMASTNPARDALVGPVERLTELVAELASAIHEYRPQSYSQATTVQSTAIPLRELLSKPRSF